MARHAPELNLALHVPAGESPLRHRIAEAIIDQIRTGRLGPGDTLPSTRRLAAELAVSRSSAVDAYDELTAAGYIAARTGSGTRIAAGADAAAHAGAASHVASTAAVTLAPPAAHRPPRPTWDLTPGHPDPGLISTTDWRRAWRAAAAAPIPAEDAGPHGHVELRRALAGHLRRTRGIVADPSELIIVPGVAAALRAITAAARLGGRDIAFEKPGYAEARQVFEMSGARTRAVAVDADGLDPGSLCESDAAVYCTPAHQFPLGARLPVPRRADLVQWAGKAGSLLIEDDYDGEFRYDVSALPALRSIDGGRDCVAYIGTASKMLTPTLRLAWLLPPPGLREAVADTLERSGESVCGITALAVARFIESGALIRHLARATRTYAARRTALVGALGRRCTGIRLAGVEAGLHMVVRLHEGIDDVALATTLCDRGVSVSPLSSFFEGNADARGLVCGYARLPETQADAVAQVIADAIAAAGGHR
ncbi:MULTISPECIES: PLP-dependent aminotransferase family protein [unclassified Mycolicibacterium]|uniref:MocR-like pyridoxine biosynthesis transcription factor PdxR n=1 Tax=unclassified Mycolicibacterium TaxID=2636767 RepID=UPI0012DED671|nr:MULTISPECIES: PLP-dependent aminotransferase family protein [unclassified Mycolicibacterium]MUL85706.1 PLP-dependent aminotransferase family protein [Mycolicibacterium sp. CBMA 329]MUL91583.1 PLP-dependent aminotransferase family protein [Mycolicibacterium sp. CBMA 331]MUM02177.1 PLP-dependent aminotransferase family protein [Mycolicibacterium sp. CBMA 334]MUM28009.1 PLP-dependent aminotransferase family protein [Mycolicibacterium sp. CBMA 295]MUM41127.1 PLP-dependent aminotransferase famil